MQALHAITDYLAHASGSPATVRQRRWALSRAVDQVAKARGTSPEQVRLGELLELAGELTHPSPATARATTSALRALAAHARTAPPAHTHQAPRLRPTPPAHTAADLARLIAYTHGPTPLATRTQAIIAVLGAHPFARGQVQQLTRAHVHLDHHGAALHLPGLEVPLEGWAGQAMRAWVGLRDQVVARLEGAPPDQLWVTLFPTTAHGRTRPAGLPLRPRGMQRAHTRAVEHVNAALLANPHLRPPYLPPSGFPTSLQALRRAGASSRWGTFVAEVT